MPLSLILLLVACLRPAGAAAAFDVVVESHHLDDGWAAWVIREDLQERVVRVRADGTTVTSIREVWTCGRPRGRDRSARLVYAPNPSLTVSARTRVTINGDTVATDDSHTYALHRARLTVGQAGERIITLHDLRAGDRVEVWLRLTQRPLIPNHFFSTVVLAKEYPVLRTLYRLTVPESAPVFHQTIGVAIDPHEELRSHERVLTWRHGPMRPWQPADSAAGPPRVLVSSTDSWEPIRRWFSEQFARAAKGDAKRARALPPLAPDSDGPKALTALARRLTRSVSTSRAEGGLAAFVPIGPEETWARRHGDCKDVALLLAVLLRRAGMRAWPALLSERPLAALLPNPFAFFHALVRVEQPDGVLFIDPQTGEVQRETRIAPYVMRLTRPESTLQGNM